MPIFSIVAPAIPAEAKDKFLAAWPTLYAELKAQPGVAGVTAGQVIGEDGGAATEFKFVQCIAFKSAEDFESFSTSEWSQEKKAKYVEASGELPVVGRFEVADFPTDAWPKPFIQFSTMILDDESKADEAKKAWLDLIAALGKPTWGGRSIGDGPTVGLALIGWDTPEEAKTAHENPAAAAAMAAYKSLGNTRNVMVKVQ